MRGICKLKLRIKEGYIVILETDKSGKLVVVTIEKYLEMGEVHVGKDIEIGEAELREREQFLNGHVSMLLKISNMGEDWGHQARHRESCIKHSAYASPMSLLIKDHKKVEEGDLPQTRPVVSGCEGLGVSISNIVSEFLEPLADSEEENFEIISSEDLLYRARICNEMIRKDWESRQEDGDLEEMPEIVMIGADVKALFPSIMSRRTGRIVRKALLRSRLKFKGINYKAAAMYVRFEMDHFEIRALGLEKIVPRRRHHKGAEPRIPGREALSGDPEKDEIRWEFPKREATEKEKINLMAACLEIGVRTCFENHVYQFGGRNYLQKSGGPIGMRVTMAAARIVMSDWARTMTDILLKANVRLYMKALYVDDKRSLMPAIEKGTRWVEKSGRFEQRDDWCQEDVHSGESSSRRTAKEMKKLMDSINPDLVFEIELEEDFEGNKLPTLDTSLWIERNVGAPPELRFEFFEKPMNNKYCMLERSAMAEKAKMSSLSQDLVRRMQNTCVEISQSRRNEIVEDFVTKLVRSGYKRSQVREIIISGLKCFKRKVKNAENTGEGLHRSAKSTLNSRRRKKILAKTNWYKTKRKVEETGDKRPARGVSKKEKNGEKPSDAQIRSLLFVPRTNGGELARRLRKEEERLSEMTGYRVKIVERSGTQIRRVLCKKNPWAGDHCQRENCMVCNQEGGGGDCKRRSVVYLTSCNQCKEKAGKEKGEGEEGEKGKVACYIGETSKSGFERGVNHQTDYRGLHLDSHILKHKILHHGEGEAISFSMKILQKHSSAFKRQVHEAVMVEMMEGENLLNSKGGFNRCTLPRLTIKMGDKEKNEGGLEEREMTDYEIEVEIRKMRKAKFRRKRGEAEEVGEMVDKQREGPPPAKKKRKWMFNFNCDMGKRKRNQEVIVQTEEKKINNKKRKIEEEVPAEDGGVCDKSLPGEEVTTGNKCRLQQIGQKIYNHDIEGKPNILKIIQKFEELSQVNEKTNQNEIKQNTSTKIKENLSKQISGGDSKGILKRTVFQFGAGPGNGQKGGGGINVIKAKPSSANKQPKKQKFKANNYKPITQYFKPAVTIEMEGKGSVGRS